MHISKAARSHYQTSHFKAAFLHPVSQQSDEAFGFSLQIQVHVEKLSIQSLVHLLLALHPAGLLHGSLHAQPVQVPGQVTQEHPHVLRVVQRNAELAESREKQKKGNTGWWRRRYKGEKEAKLPRRRGKWGKYCHPAPSMLQFSDEHYLHNESFVVSAQLVPLNLACDHLRVANSFAAEILRGIKPLSQSFDCKLLIFPPSHACITAGCEYVCVATQEVALTSVKRVTKMNAPAESGQASWSHISRTWLKQAVTSTAEELCWAC